VRRNKARLIRLIFLERRVTWEEMIRMRIHILNVRYSTTLERIVSCSLRAGPNETISSWKLVKMQIVSGSSSCARRLGTWREFEVGVNELC
jgi:hypothetical protein